MIFYLKQNNLLERQDSDRIFQGSNQANKIFVVTQYGASANLEIAFTLPNGAAINPMPMFKESTEYSVDPNDMNNKVTLWSYTLPFNATVQRGKVQVEVIVKTKLSKPTGLPAPNDYKPYWNTIGTFNGDFLVEYGVIPRDITPDDQSDIDRLIDLMRDYYNYIVNGASEFIDLGAHLPKYNTEDNAFDISDENVAKLFANVPPIVKITNQSSGVPVNVYRHDILDGGKTAYYTSTLFYDDVKYWSVLEVSLDTKKGIFRYEEEPIIPKIGSDDAQKVIQVNDQSNGFQFTPTKAVEKSYPIKATQIGFDKNAMSDANNRIPSSFAVSQAIGSKATKVIVHGIPQESVDFTLDPQTQIDVIESDVEENRRAIGLNVDGIARVEQLKQNKLPQVDLDNIASIDRMKDDIATHTTNINKNTADIAQNQRDIKTNKDDIAALVLTGGGTLVNVGGQAQGTLAFDSDPQTQLTTLASKVETNTSEISYLNGGYTDADLDTIFSEGKLKFFKSVSSNSPNAPSSSNGCLFVFPSFLFEQQRYITISGEMWSRYYDNYYKKWSEWVRR